MIPTDRRWHVAVGAGVMALQKMCKMQFFGFKVSEGFLRIPEAQADQPKFPTLGQLCFHVFSYMAIFWICYQSSKILREISMATNQAPQTQIVPSCVRDTFVEQRFLEKSTSLV